jgi:hypothetical protein
MVVRVPIKIKRKPFTAFTEQGRSMGGWCPFPMPEDRKYPPGKMIQKCPRGCETLWCPWCADWTYFKKDKGVSHCTGWCHLGNTDEYYTKTINHLW